MVGAYFFTWTCCPDLAKLLPLPCKCRVSRMRFPVKGHRPSGSMRLWYTDVRTTVPSCPFLSTQYAVASLRRRGLCDTAHTNDNDDDCCPAAPTVGGGVDDVCWPDFAPPSLPSLSPSRRNRTLHTSLRRSGCCVLGDKGRSGGGGPTSRAALVCAFANQYDVRCKSCSLACRCASAVNEEEALDFLV